MIAALVAALAIQAAPYGTISVKHVGNDETGRAIAMRLSDELRRSGRFDVVRPSDDPTGYQVHMATLGTDYSMNMTVFNVVLTDSRGVMLAHTVGTCRVGEGAACASNAYEWLVPMIDRSIQTNASRFACLAVGICE